MNWSDERYVRVYTRDTTDLMAIGWEGRLVLYELLRHADRAGVIDTGGDLAALPELLRVPSDIFERGFPRIVARGSVKVLERSLFLPNYHPAQEAKQTDAHRQRESRLRRLELARAQGLSPEAARTEARPDYYQPAELVTNRDQTSQSVTNGHDWSQLVTSGHSVPSLAVPSPEEACVRREAPDAPPRKKRARKGPTGPAAEQAAGFLEWFNRKLERRFELRDPVVRLVARLMEDGFGQGDMRIVAAHARERWEADPKMQEFLKPSTLLAREKFGERLDAAKQAHPEWASRTARLNAGGLADGSSLPTVPTTGADVRGREGHDGRNE